MQTHEYAYEVLSKNFHENYLNFRSETFFGGIPKEICKIIQINPNQVNTYKCIFAHFEKMLFYLLDALFNKCNASEFSIL